MSVDCLWCKLHTEIIVSTCENKNILLWSITLKFYFTLIQISKLSRILCRFCENIVNVRPCQKIANFSLNHHISSYIFFICLDFTILRNFLCCLDPNPSVICRHFNYGFCNIPFVQWWPRCVSPQSSELLLPLRELPDSVYSVNM